MPTELERRVNRSEIPSIKARSVLLGGTLAVPAGCSDRARNSGTDTHRRALPYDTSHNTPVLTAAWFQEDRS